MVFFRCPADHSHLYKNPLHGKNTRKQLALSLSLSLPARISPLVANDARGVDQSDDHRLPPREVPNQTHKGETSDRWTSPREKRDSHVDGTANLSPWTSLSKQGSSWISELESSSKVDLPLPEDWTRVEWHPPTRGVQFS